MVTIQILHKPLLGYGISVYINYCFNRHLFKAAKIVSGKQIGYRYKSHTYFIIKSFFLSFNQMYKRFKVILMTLLFLLEAILITTTFSEIIIVCLVSSTQPLINRLNVSKTKFMITCSKNNQRAY